MPLEQAVEYALTGEEARLSAVQEPPATDQRAALTPREWEVAILIARGLTNRQIAEELYISERTADTHVGKILKKLGLKIRAEVAARVGEG